MLRQFETNAAKIRHKKNGKIFKGCSIINKNLKYVFLPRCTKNSDRICFLFYNDNLPLFVIISAGQESCSRDLRQATYRTATEYKQLQWILALKTNNRQLTTYCIHILWLIICAWKNCIDLFWSNFLGGGKIDFKTVVVYLPPSYLAYKLF